MKLNLEGKKVLVTGGSKGIGKAIARAFLEEGAEVGIAASTKESLSHAAEELGGNTAQFQGDLTSEADRDRVFREFTDHFGRIDVLVNNVGGSNGSSVMETSLTEFQEAMDLNFMSAVHFSQLAGGAMKENGGGSIVNISSIFGRESGGKPTYNSAKSAMISFTKAFADEMIKDGVRVNGVAPGAILHPTGNWQKKLEADPEKIEAYVEAEIPAGRFGTVEEVADVAVFLASERARWVSGATLNVDGGQSRMNF
ncbi:SDR family NAD(P)-dependent oxidoreductase [Alteribacter natronophilus]|uniref:SDR family NAD(P)-dependent oxidoreductase n=1 Tax=Alteribacter natronophilus TaxID=2583810 RepID=UPI00110D49EE|nr:glucose 1-dehydrogenase [Alteribacter natronophilus]TMW70576.1 glucose 1-dehydrogenase [Alteribacter natronophilus]